MTPTTFAEWTSFMLLAGMFGAIGQVIRAVAGLKKAQDASRAGAAEFSAKFEWPTFVVSLIIGFTAGVLACLAVTFPVTVDVKLLLTFIAAGYAGADFIEAFIKKHLPGGGAAKCVGAAAPPCPGDPSSRSIQPQGAAMPMSVEQAIIQIIAELKHINPSTVTPGKKLSELQFVSATERRNLANEINDFFQHRLNMVFDTLMHPSETEDDQTVAEVIQKVKAKNPRPRARPVAEPR